MGWGVLCCCYACIRFLAFGFHNCWNVLLEPWCSPVDFGWWFLRLVGCWRLVDLMLWAFMPPGVKFRLILFFLGLGTWDDVFMARWSLCKYVWRFSCLCNYYGFWQIVLRLYTSTIIHFHFLARFAILLRLWCTPATFIISSSAYTISQLLIIGTGAPPHCRLLFSVLFTIAIPLRPDVHLVNTSDYLTLPACDEMRLIIQYSFFLPFFS